MAKTEFDFTFTQPEQPLRNHIINAKVSRVEAATIDALAVLLGMRNGRSGVIRKGLDTLVASLPEDTRVNLMEMVKASIEEDDD